MFLESASTGNDGTFSVYSLIAIVIFLLIGFAMYDLVRRAKEKEFYKSYREIINKKTGKPQFTGLKSIGEFKEETFNSDKRCYEFRMRKNMKYYHIYSNYTMSQLKKVHLIDRNYLVVYSLNCYVFEKQLKESEFYERELGWTIQAYLYRFFSFCFSLNMSGLIFSPLIMGSIFAWSFPDLPFMFLVGCVLGLLISTINQVIKKSERIQDTLLKKKLELVKVETYISPLESEEEIQDVYRIQGTRNQLVETVDEATNYETVKLQDIPKNPDKEPKEYLTVIGFDDLYRLKTNPLVKIKKVKWHKITRRKRTNQEMLNLKRSYLSRNKTLVLDNFRLKEIYENLQKEYRNLQEQLNQVQESVFKEIKKLGNQTTKQRQKEKTTLRNIYEEIHGAQFVSENFEKTHERVIKVINYNNSEKIDAIYRGIKFLLEKESKKTDLEQQKDIEKILKITDIEDGNGRKPKM